jgi:ribosome maturation factor RimP
MKNIEKQKSGNKSHSSLIDKEGKMASIENKVENLIQEKVEEIGYDLYDVEYVKEGKNYFLRVYIDNEKGISLEDCEKVSNEINPLLDEANIIAEQYFLEVSSPGIERVLRKDKHLEKNIGKEVEVKLFKKDEKGNKSYTGILNDFSEEKVKIEETEISREDIAQIKTIYNW